MLSKILTDRRNSLGMSVDQLAEKSGISKSTVAKILSGVYANPTLETAKAIAYALGLTLDDIAEDDSGKSSLSLAALRIAKAYDRMSDYGKAIIHCVVEQERYAANREAAELKDEQAEALRRR